MFIHYDKQDKKKYVIFKTLNFLLLAAMFTLALKLTKTELPDIESKFSISIGFVLVGLTYIIATTKLVKVVVKFKSIGFLLALGIIYFFRLVIDTLYVSIGLALIPLLINDLGINLYFSYLNQTKYFETYWKIKNA